MDEGFPAYLNLVRQSMASDGIFLFYTCLNIYIWVGSQADPGFVQDLFNVNSSAEIDMLTAEHQIFDNCEGSSYQAKLYDFVTQLRGQSTQYGLIRVIKEGDQESNQIVSNLLIEDSLNPVYMQDFQKFYNSMTGDGSGMLPGGNAPAYGGSPGGAGGAAGGMPPRY